MIENGDGGDLIAKKNDLSVIYGFENMPYIALFGGNVEASTPVRRLVTEQAFDFWGNDLELDPSLQFNSLTERTLMNTPLNSRGRTLIQQAVRRDLDFMKPFAQIGIDVIITGVDKVVIAIRLIRLDNIQQRDFIYIWDATIAELIQRESMPGGGAAVPITDKIFDFSFDFSFE